jgi:hypothetical protein
MAGAAKELRPDGGPVIYGTIRLIERDTENLLAGARQEFARVLLKPGPALRFWRERRHYRMMFTAP